MRVQPRAKHNEITGVKDGMLLVRTTAPPTAGQANKTVLKLLATHLDIAPSRLTLLRGHAHRHKQVRLLGPL